MTSVLKYMHVKSQDMLHEAPLPPGEKVLEGFMEEGILEGE